MDRPHFFMIKCIHFSRLGIIWLTFELSTKQRDFITDWTKRDIKKDVIVLTKFKSGSKISKKNQLLLTD